MAEVTSAATLVAAVLEHQGYLLQARFLDTFQDFFRDAGGLVYLIAAVGAVTSLLMFGSFRAPRYLLIGPALFWFLIGPRAENVDGVVWKLGAGEERGLKGEAGAARTTRQQILDKLNHSGEGPGSSPEVAQGFWLFARPINEFTNEMVDFLLKDEDRSDLLVASKVYGLELISTSLPNDVDYIQRVEGGFMKGCQSLMSAAHSAAAVIIKQNAGDGGIPQQEFEKILNHHTLQLQKYGELTISSKHTGFDALIEAQTEGGGGSETAKAIKDRGDESKLTCAEAWTLIAEETWHRAALGQDRILRVATLGLRVPALDEYACKALTAKAVAQTGDQGIDFGDCNMQPAIALALLNKRLTQTSVYNRVASRHWNDTQHRNPTSHVLLTSGGQGSAFEPIKRAGQVLMRTFTDGVNRVASSVGLTRSETVNGRTQRTVLWAPVMELNQNYGMNDAMWVATRQHEIVKLRQQLFSYALNLPYYQGILLYFLAAVYPFFALLVLLPGKAIQFMNIPMAWLWVKSWDIGFAAMIILDKVMYNLLPSRQVNETLRTGPWTDLTQLPLILSEAYNFDPMGSIHSYYSIMSFVWFSIPIITGYVTLRSRRGVLSAFSDAAANLAKESGEAAASGFSIAAQDKRTQMLKEMQGFATKLPTMGSNGVGSGMPGAVGKMMATIAAGAKATSGMTMQDVGNLRNGDLKQLATLGGQVAKTYQQTYRDTVQSETKLQSQVSRIFDPGVGRWSNVGMLHGAYTAAMDGGGGYELYNHDESASSQLISAFKHKLGIMMDAATDTQSAFAKNLYGAVRGEGPPAMSIPWLMTAASAAALSADPDTFLAKVKAMSGAEGFSDQQFLTALTHRHPSLGRGTFGADKVANARQDFFGAYFGVLSDHQAPGGYSSYLNTVLGTVGGDRHVEYVDANSPTAAQRLQETKEYAATYSRGSGGPISTPGSSFSHNLVGDMEDQIRAPQLYAGEVARRQGMLIGLYGQKNLENYFGLAAGAPITTEHLFDYTSHLQSQEPNQDSTWFRNNQLDSRVGGEIGKKHPLMALEEIDEWNHRRGERYRGFRTGPRPVRGKVVIGPAGAWSND